MLWWASFGGTGLTFLQLFALAIEEGVTTVLPISSQAHLLLVAAVTGAPAGNTAIDLAVHVGVLAAVVAYFWRDSWSMVTGLWRFARNRRSNPGIRLIGLLVLGTTPIAAAAYALKAATAGAGVGGTEVIAWATLGFGLLLYIIDRTCLTVSRMEHVGAGSVLVIGLFQVLALLPGASRAGVTMTAARLLGYERPDAARVSLLLSIPAILGSGALLCLDLHRSGETALGLAAVLAAVAGFVAAFIAIAAMMSWLRRSSFAPLAIYRVLLGAFLLIWLYTTWFGGFLPPAPH
jgi:undecaprenyl-diphosphatase